MQLQWSAPGSHGYRRSHHHHVMPRSWRMVAGAQRCPDQEGSANRGSDASVVGGAPNLSTVVEMYAWVVVAEPLCGGETASQGRSDGTSSCGGETASQGRSDGTSSRRCVVGGGEDAVSNLLMAARRLTVGHGTLVAVADAVYT
jgi:hypothetical protein